MAKKDMNWINELSKKNADCPCQLQKCKEYVCLTESGSWSPAPRVYVSRETDEFCPPDGGQWAPYGAKKPSQKGHPGGEYDVRLNARSGASGIQCVYDKGGKLLTEPPGAGSGDHSAPGYGLSLLRHAIDDVLPFNWAKELDGDPDHPKAEGKHFQMYMEVRPVNKGKDPTTKKECPKNPQ